MNCPWCGKELKTGKIRFYCNAGLAWEDTDREYSKSERLFHDNRRAIKFQNRPDRALSSVCKVEAFHCPDCRKMIFDGWMD